MVHLYKPFQPVYPRWRGEHGRPNVYGQCRVGLSPLARGTRFNVARDVHLRRFIPAGAGNTRLHRGRCHLSTVYPRWRGEHDIVAVIPQQPSGLSPLARGTLLRLKQHGEPGRFIPAGAGNTRTMRSVRSTRPVYPRWRGEHIDAILQVIKDSGLSPLARGTLVVVV